MRRSTPRWRSWLRASLFALALGAALPALAAWGPPHDGSNGIDCHDCHNLHGPNPLRPEGAEQETLCRTCHNPTGTASSMTEFALHTVEGGATVVDCGACHDVHGPQAPTVDTHPGGGTAENLKLVRADVAHYRPGAVEPAVFQSSPEHFTFDSAPSNGICQACHTTTNHFRNDASSNDAHNGGVDCRSCHTHEDGFLASCGDCHGAPPVVDLPQIGDGLVAVPTPSGSTTAGAHDTHANAQGVTCISCHASITTFGPTHDSDATITLDFVLFEGAVVGGSYDGQVGVAYDTTDPVNTTVSSGGTLTCSDIYCHSNGQSADGTTGPSVYGTPAWNGAPLACDGCHGNSPSNGSHGAHGWTTCNECHAGSEHVDHSVDVVPGLGYSHGGPPGNGYGVCWSGCHTGATWGGPPIMCGDCHGGAPMGGSGHGAGTRNRPQAPAVLVPEPDLVSTTAANVTFDWAAAAPSAGWITEYQAQVDLDPGFGGFWGSGLFNSGWTTSRSWTRSLDTSRTWYWRVKARDQARTWLVGTSAVDDFDIRLDANTPLAPVLTAEPDYNSVGLPVPMTLEWSAVTAPDADPVEYSAVVDDDPTFATPDFSSGWTTATSLAITATPETTYHWRVQARDQVHPTYVSSWSQVDVFWDRWSSSGSCPFLYVWDGGGFKFQTDLYGAGKLAAAGSRGTFTPNPHDAYVLASLPQPRDGTLQMRLVEERFETDYLDELKLYAVDLPADRDLLGEKPGFGGTLPSLPEVLHTVARSRNPPLSVTHLNTGADVTAKLSASDGDYLVLGNDRNLDFEYHTLELDLGDLTAAPQVKLIIDANTAFPTTPEGAARSALFGPRTRLEVLDPAGQWVSVAKAIAELPKPPEFPRVFALDISDIFQTQDHRVRLTFLFKTYLDAIHFDVTPDQPISLNEVPLVSAELRSYGLSDSVPIFEELFDYLYRESNPNHLHAYFPGLHTRFGDVLPLLQATDDKFVIYGDGDELDLHFTPPASPPMGSNRAYLLYTNGYYKDVKVNVPHTVEPLPFEAMSGFPYDEAVEHYPDDPEHQLYRATYNTRLQ